MQFIVQASWQAFGSRYSRYSVLCVVQTLQVEWWDWCVGAFAEKADLNEEGNENILERYGQAARAQLPPFMHEMCLTDPCAEP